MQKEKEKAARKKQAGFLLPVRMLLMNSLPFEHAKKSLHLDGMRGSAEVKGDLYKAHVLKGHSGVGVLKEGSDNNQDMRHVHVAVRKPS